MEYDVAIVGGGFAGLSAAICMKQLAAEQGRKVSVCVLEKGSEAGAHILSGAVMDPIAMNELFSNWKELGALLNTPVTEDQFLFLTEKRATKMHKPGLVIHTAGWPLDADTYGGSFLYHLENNQVAVGYVVGLAYQTPHLPPYEEFQRYKTHPEIRKYSEGGKCNSYGARALTAGGLQSLPKLTFPGGVLIGCDAGFLNASRIKGSHAAMKTGMMAAEAAFEALGAGRAQDELTPHPEAFKTSWLHEELYKGRDFKPFMTQGLYKGTLMVGIDQVLFRGEAPLKLRHKHADHECLRPPSDFKPNIYPKPDCKLTFDKLSSVFISNTSHAEEQPVHLTLQSRDIPVEINLTRYAGPEQRYCPAGVYEYVQNDADEYRLPITAQNCVYYETCDIKDPTQNIVWITPEGGGGPNYSRM